MSDKEIPQEHQPIIHELHLGTDMSFVDAWEIFCFTCMELSELIQQRRTTKLEEQSKTMQSEMIAQKESA